MVGVSRKFEEHSLNLHPELEPGLKEKLDKINFNRCSKFGYKDHIREHSSIPGWLIKRVRTDVVADRPAFRADSNLYRVRKAKKMTRLLQGNNSILIPKKYIYTTSSGETVVIAQKLEGTVFNKLFNAKQAEGLALLATKASFYDFHLSNFLKVSDTQIALIDTEAVDRGVKKYCTQFIHRLLGSAFVVDLIGKAAGLTRLSKMCDKEGEQIAISVKRRYFFKQFAITITKIALAAIAITALCLTAPLPAALVLTPFLGAYLLVKTIHLFAIPTIYLLTD